MGLARGLDKEQVLDAAAAIVDAAGADALTLAALAGRLGVRSQSLYAHVDGLDGLRRDLAVRAQLVLAARLRRAVMAKSGPDALRALAHAYARFAADHPGLYASSLRSPDGDDALEASIAEASEPWYAVLTSFGLNRTEVVHHHRILWAALHGFVDLREQGLMTRSASVDRSFSLLVEVFVSSLAPAGDGRQH